MGLERTAHAEAGAKRGGDLQYTRQEGATPQSREERHPSAGPDFPVGSDSTESYTRDAPKRQLLLLLRMTYLSQESRAAIAGTLQVDAREGFILRI